MNIGSSTSNLNSLNRIQNSINDSIQRIATGSKNPTAASNPSDYAIVRRMNSQIGAVNQSNTNTQNMNAMLQTAGGAVNNTVEALTSLRETIINAANGTNNSSDRGNLQKAVDQTIAQIDENAGVTYNGMNLLNGSSSFAVAGVDGYSNVNLGNMSSQALGLTDEDGNSLIDLSNPESIDQALARVDSALGTAREESNNIDTANAALDEATSIGAFEQALGYQSANYTTMSENLEDAVTTMDATDIAAEVTKLKSSQTQEQLALYGQKMFMHNQSAVLSLLQ